MFRKFAALILAAGIVPAAAYAGEAGKAEKPAWPSNARVVEAQLTKKAVQGMEGGFNLPQFRVYDARGHKVFDANGYSHDFAAKLSELLAVGGKPDASSSSLGSELAAVVSPDGKPIGSLPEAPLTFVKYWAEWCVPCHAQSRDLVKILGEHPDVRVTVLNVEADIMKMMGAEGQTVRRISLEEIDPEAAKKLKDPNLTEEQKKKILEEALAKSKKEGVKKDKP
ncbi:MAG TPA: thioredoxin family protein [Thermoanaerobaculia bacterium]